METTDSTGSGGKDGDRHFTCKALVLKRRPLGEADALIVLLAPSGRLDCIVQGGYKSKRWGALIEPLSLLEGQFARGRTFVYLREARMLTGFQPLRENLDLLQVAGYWIDLCGSVAQVHQDSRLLFRALVWALKELGEGFPRAALNFWLELRLLASLGLSPSMDECLHCQSPSVSAWDARGGGLVCSSCCPQPDCPLSSLAVAVVRALAQCPPQALQDMHVPAEESTQIFRALRRHLLEQVGESSRVYKSHPEIGHLLLAE